MVLLVQATALQAQTPFEIRDGNFWYNNKPTRILSGEMHYARVPREYWQHRLRMMKAMGLNTVATYVFWNFHEPKPGVWDFETDNHDLAAFVKLAQAEGMFVILRPGPYACAEWEFGGYPWWLQQNKSLEIRTFNQPFLDSCRVYLQHLAREVAPLQVSKGGPIIMVQVENEFGSYVAQRKDIPLAQHQAYNKAILSLLKEAGFEGPFFTSDGSWLFEGGSIPGILPTANGEGDIFNLQKVVNQYHGGEGPYMVAEYYPGWLDHWGEEFVNVQPEPVANQVARYLVNNVHLNFYMVHGGTNFGFTSGANYNTDYDIQPDITSYDYDAPISEAGWATPKYQALRTVIQRYSVGVLPPVPAPITVITPAFTVQQSSDVLSWLHTQKPVMAEKPLTFEALGQGHGYVLYSRTFTTSAKGILNVAGLRDYACVYVNGKRMGTLNRITKSYALEVDIPAGGVLDILVENMGRINYGADIIHNTKGIIEPVLLNEEPVTGSWNMYQLPFDEVPVMQAGKALKDRPALYQAEVTLDQTGDVFLDMRTWGKGIVIVNGHPIGRYWSIGPQQTLYVPGCWLKKGKNTIVIFEQLHDTLHTEVNTSALPILDQLRKP